MVEGIVSIVFRIAAYGTTVRGMPSPTNLIEPALRAALGIFLIFRGPALALFWHKLRTGGTIHQEDRK